jgi:hypothetical protein
LYVGGFLRPRDDGGQLLIGELVHDLTLSQSQ